MSNQKERAVGLQIFGIRELLNMCKPAESKIIICVFIIKDNNQAIVFQPCSCIPILLVNFPREINNRGNNSTLATNKVDDLDEFSVGVTANV